MTLTIEVDFETYAEGLDRRATILREWLLFLKTFPMAVLPVSGERPFDCDRCEG